MKKVFIILISFIFAFNIYAKRVNIITTIFPIGDIIKNIYPEAKVKVIIKEGQNPHLYAPSPADIKSFNNADIFIKIGYGFENWFNKILGSIQNKKLVILDLSKYIKPLMYDKKNKVANPHYWLSPYEVLKFLPAIKKELIKKIPEKKNIIEKNYKKYRKKLIQLDRKIKSNIQKAAKKSIIVSHPILNYFAEDYGLKIVGILKEKGNTVASPKKFIKILNAIRKYNIKYILTSEIDTNISKKIASESNIKILPIAPIGGKSEKFRDTYINLINYNLNNVVKALK